MTPYRSPSTLPLVRALENRFLAADESSWTGRKPLFTRVVADVPDALYINFLAKKSYAASLAPGVFHPIDLPGDDGATLFTILFFTLLRARPLVAPFRLGILAPAFIQSNWRFYGHLSTPGFDRQRGVLFVRTVTTSLMLSLFGRRFARCFPLRRARRMNLTVRKGHVECAIDPGQGSAPALRFRAKPISSPKVSDVFGKQFTSFEQYARWIMNQHLSLAVWPREYVVQDMRLDFGVAEILPLQSLSCVVTGLDSFVSDSSRVLDCFAVKNLKVYLDNMHAHARPTY